MHCSLDWDNVYGAIMVQFAHGKVLHIIFQQLLKVTS